MKRNNIKIVSAIFALVLILSVFSCLFAACTNNNGTDDNNAETPAALKKIGATHYTKPAKSTVTEQDVDQVLKTAFQGTELSDLADEEEVLQIVTSVARESGFTKQELTALSVAIKNVLDNLVDPIIDRLRDFDYENYSAAIKSLIKDIFTKQNVQTALNSIKTIASLDSDKALTAGITSAYFITNYRLDYFNYDLDTVKTLTKQNGGNDTYLYSAQSDNISSLVKTDEAVYVVKTLLNMVDKLSGLSSQEIVDISDVVGKIIIAADGDINGILEGRTVSYKDLVKAINFAGKVANAVLDGVGDFEQFGIALSKVFSSVMDSFFDYINPDYVTELVKYPQVLRLVTNTLEKITIDDLSNLYANYNDWEVALNADDDKATEKFGYFIASCVQIVKPEYDKLSASVRQNVLNTLNKVFDYQGNLARDVQALCDMVNGNIDSFDSNKKTAIANAAQAIVDNVNDVDFFHYYDQYDKDLRVAGGTGVVLKDNANRQEVIEALDNAGFYIRSRYYDEKVSFGEIEALQSGTDINWQYAFETVNGIRKLKIYGDDISTKYITILDTANLKLSAEFTFLRISKDATEAVIKQQIANVVDDFYYYDTKNGVSEYYYCDIKPEDVTLVGTVKYKDGYDVLPITVATDLGLVKTIVIYKAYDPENPKIERLSVNGRNYFVKDQVEQISGYAYYDNGEDEDFAVNVSDIVGFDTTVKGKKEASITYKGFTQKVTYNVYDRSDLTVTNLYCDSTRYVNLDATIDDFQFYYIEASLRSDDGDYMYMELDKSHYVIEGFDTSTTGDHTATVKTVGFKNEYSRDFEYYVYE